MDTEITVTARQWSHGWELILDEDNATQVRTLGRAQTQVRDYLDTVHPEVDHSELRVHLVLDADDVTQEIERARQARETAELAEAQAARLIRDVVGDLRRSRGLSVTDTAAILGISRSRVSQLESSVAV